MLAIDHRLAASGDRRLHAVGDRIEVLLQRAAERDMDMVVPGLGDIDDRVGVGGEKAREARIVGGRAAGALGHAEGAEAGVSRGFAFEEFGVERVRARIAALDIVDSEPVEHGGDAALVVEREVDAGGERAVAHRGVEQVEAFLGHGGHNRKGRRRVVTLIPRSRAKRGVSKDDPESGAVSALWSALRDAPPAAPLLRTRG